MKKMGKRAVVMRIGLSLAATAITAAGFAAISIASNDGGNGDESGVQSAREAPPGPPALSEEDQAKLEDFRSCMEENGAPAPPDPGEMRERLRSGERPDPPSEADREKMEKAFEACKDKAPEGVHMFFGGPGGHGCGPGGPPPAREESGDGQGENQSQGFVAPAPAPSGTT